MATQKADRRPELREHAEPGAAAGRRVLGREQRRAAPFAAEPDALAEAQQAEQPRRERARLGVARQDADQRGRQAHRQHRGDERRLAADAVAEMAEQDRADRAREEGDAEGQKGVERLRSAAPSAERTSGRSPAPRRCRRCRNRRTRSSCRSRLASTMRPTLTFPSPAAANAVAAVPEFAGISLPVLTSPIVPSGRFHPARTIPSQRPIGEMGFARPISPRHIDVSACRPAVAQARSKHRGKFLLEFLAAVRATTARRVAARS